MFFCIAVKSHPDFYGYEKILHERVFFNLFKFLVIFWLAHLFWLFTFFQFFIALYIV